MRNLLLFITLISSLAACSHDSNFAAIESISAKEKPLKIITYKIGEFRPGIQRRIGNRTADHTRRRRWSL